MKKPRVSIARLMAFIVLIAVGFAALKNPHGARGERHVLDHDGPVAAGVGGPGVPQG